MNYTLTAGQTNTRQLSDDQVRERWWVENTQRLEAHVLEWLADQERILTDLRSQEAALDVQMAKQRQWMINPSSRRHPLYAQRGDIYAARIEERYERTSEIDRTLDAAFEAIRRFDNDDCDEAAKERVRARLLAFEEPPFAFLAFAFAVGSMLRMVECAIIL